MNTRVLLLGLIALVPVSAFQPAALATTFTVNGTADTVDANAGNGVCADASGVCTLRAAVREANAHPGDDAIELPSGTFLLTIPGSEEDFAASGDLDIRGNLTIRGAGQTSTVIDGGGAILNDRVIQIFSSFTVTISDLTIRGGRAVSLPGEHSMGGGILNAGNLALSHVVVRDCDSIRVGDNASSGGGLQSSGSASISDGTFVNNSADYGAGIFSTGGGLALDRSVFSGNSGTLGGSAVYSSPTSSRFTAVDCTFSENFGSPAIFSNGHADVTGCTVSNNTGGGIHNSGVMVLTNSTLSGNTILGGFFGFGSGIPVAIITNCTFAENDGFFASDIRNVGSSVIELRNTIVAGATSAPACAGPIGDGGGNITWADDSCPGTRVDPQLGPLADNGGPTQTRALMGQSAAIDAVLYAACPAEDQRGVVRPQGAACDIGAYESCAGTPGCDLCPGVVCLPIDACHEVGTCDPATARCSPGPAIICNDEDDCTTDSCNPTAGCLYLNNTGTCDDGNACTANDICGPEAFIESFDGVAAPDLPAEWTSFVTGVGMAWATASPSSDTPPNAAFGLNSDQVADEVLESPPVAIVSSSAKLSFRNRWSFETDGPQCYDGGVLELKIGTGPYEDIVSAGGSFISGGYSGIVEDGYENPLANRAAWCRMSPGYPAYVATAVALPAAAMGQVVRLRWRIGTDLSYSVVGQDIDSIVIADPPACSGSTPVDCDDQNPCTDDSCDPSQGCAHTPVVCAPPDQCHAAGTCDIGSGACNYPPLPDGTACDDGDSETIGDACTAGVCAGRSGCNTHPNPKPEGYYKKLCKDGHGNPHASDALTDAEAICVGQLTDTFAGISTVDDICAEWDHDTNGTQHDTDGPQGEECEDKAERELMALALNICRDRVCLSQEVDSNCASDPHDHALTTVQESLDTVDDILSDPARDKTTCKGGRCLAKEINNGKGLHHTSLLLSKEPGAGNKVRLTWDSPVMEDGSGEASGYTVWRRVLNADAVFVKLTETSNLTYLDATAGTGAYEYEVTFTIEP